MKSSVNTNVSLPRSPTAHSLPTLYFPSVPATSPSTARGASGATTQAENGWHRTFSTSWQDNKETLFNNEDSGGLICHPMSIRVGSGPWESVLLCMSQPLRPEAWPSPPPPQCHGPPCPCRLSGQPVASDHVCGWKEVCWESQAPNNNMEKMLQRRALTWLRRKPPSLK